MSGRRHLPVLVAAATLAGSPSVANSPQPAPMTPALAARACAVEPLSSSGTIHYVCDCQPGAAAHCQAGSDRNTGRTAGSAWRTIAKARAEFPNLRAGDTLAFCRGGVFQDDGRDEPWFNGNCRAGRPCQIRDYRPRWGSDRDGDPKLRNVHLTISNGGGARHKEGLDVRNLQLEGQGKGWGIMLYNDTKDVSLCNLTVQNYEIAVFAAGGNPPEAGSDGLDARIALRGSRLVHNKDMGWLGSCDGCAIEYNVFDHDGDANMLDHSIYLGGANLKHAPHYRVHGMRVVGNQIRHSAAGTGRLCKGAPIVVHGDQDDLLIQGNAIAEEVGEADDGCWGIMVSAYPTEAGFRRVVISGNSVRNVGNTSIDVSSCQQCVVENNVIVQAQPSLSARGIVVHTNGDPGPANLRGTAATVRNNTLFFATSRSTEGITVGSEGRDHVVAGNVIVQAGAGQLSCFVYDLPPSAYYADHNACWNPRQEAARWEAHSEALAAWRQTSGLDAHSSFGNPLLVHMSWKGDDFSPAARSPLIGAGDPAHAPALDFLGRRRGTPPDAGAFEHR